MNKIKTIVLNEVRKLRSKLFTKQIELDRLTKDLKELESQLEEMD